MHRYRLEMDDHGFGHADTVEFEAEDAGNAIYLMSRIAPGRHAQLWEGDRFMCTLSQDPTGNGFWRVAASR